MLILTQFILRLSFGLAAAMALTDYRAVTSGYYRNNSYVLLGLNVLGALVAYGGMRGASLPVWPLTAAAALSYAGAVCWLYEKPRWGVATLVLVAICALGGDWFLSASMQSAALGTVQRWLVLANPVASGAVLGATMAAMLLGHWYLNAPGMKLAPLKKLIGLLLTALAARGALSLVALALQLEAGPLTPTQWSLVVLRWVAGIVGPAVAAWSSRKTLEIPNTQSATGILYAAVIGTFLGEMTAALLSAEVAYPV